MPLPNSKGFDIRIRLLDNVVTNMTTCRLEREAIVRTIGVKELKEHLSEVLREVEETGQIVGVSRRGRIVARLVPAGNGRPTSRDPRATIADIASLVAQLSRDLPATVNVEEVINDIRR
jgi:prevent-host-death family protein